MIITREFASSSSDTKHVVRFDTDTGAVSCSCRGWRGNKNCWHTKAMTEEPTVPAKLDRPVSGIPVKPMLASAMTLHTFKDYCTPDWRLEEKFDGHRVIARVSGSGVEAWSRPRSGKEALPKTLPPHLVTLLGRLPAGIYDGELIASGARSRSSNVTRLDMQATNRLVLFDALELLGKPMGKMDYRARRAALVVALAHVSDPALVMSVDLPVTAANLAHIMDRGGEGAILKRVASTYQPNRRSPDWIKVKRSGSVVMVITGFEAGKSGPHSVAIGTAPDGRAMRVKTKDNATRDEIARNPKAFIDKRLMIAYTERSEEGAYLNGTWDHLAGKGE